MEGAARAPARLRIAVRGAAGVGGERPTRGGARHDRRRVRHPAASPGVPLPQRCARALGFHGLGFPSRWTRLMFKRSLRVL